VSTRTIPVPYLFHTRSIPKTAQEQSQDSPGAVPYLSICAGMEQAVVPYYGTRLVPYPSGRYGTSLRSILWNKACANGQPWDKVKKITAIYVIVL